MSDAVIIALGTSVISAAGLIVVAFIKRDQNRLHKQINSRMDELLAAAKAAGKQEQKDETNGSN